MFMTHLMYGYCSFPFLAVAGVNLICSLTPWCSSKFCQCCPTQQLSLQIILRAERPTRCSISQRVLTSGHAQWEKYATQHWEAGKRGDRFPSNSACPGATEGKLAIRRNHVLTNQSWSIKSHWGIAISKFTVFCSCFFSRPHNIKLKTLC